MDDFWDLDEPPTDGSSVSVAEAPSVEVLAAPGAESPHPSPLPPPPVAAPIVPVQENRLAQRNEAHDRLREMETEILRESLEVIDGALAFPDVLDTDLNPLEEVPEAWVEKYGVEGARRRFIIAKSACMSAKNAPVALKMAQQTAVGAMAALEKAKQGPAVFNLQFVQMVRPHVYEEVEIVESPT